MVGVPGKVVKRDNIKVPSEDLDQRLPDPVQNQIDHLDKTIHSLSLRYNELHEQINDKKIENEDDINK